jgi:Na+-driven multidrug efflux pump
VISGFVNIAVVVFLVWKKRLPYVLEISGHFRWTGALVSEYLRKCFPILANELLIGVGNMMINIVLGHQVDEAIAATAVLRTLEGLVIGFFAGFSSAATVLVGKEVGAGNHEEAYSRAWRLIYLCSGMIAVVGAVLFAVHRPLLHAMGMSGESFRIARGMMIIYCLVALIRMQNWCMNDTFRSAGDSAFGSIMEIAFMFLMVQPVIHLANDYFHAPFLLVFLLCYVDEPIRYIIMQRHMYSGKWIKPVSDTGKATIGEFRKKHHIK